MNVRALWFRSILAKPLRFALTILGVSIGVASVVSTVLANRAAVVSLGEDVETISGRAALEIRRPGGVDLADLAGVRELAGEALFVPVVEGVLDVDELGGLTRLFGVDLLVDAEVRALDLAFEDGSGADAAQRGLDLMLRGNGVAVSARLAEEVGLAAGATLRSVAEARPVTLEVAAVFEPERFATAWDRVLVADVALAQEVLGRRGVDRVEVLPRTDAPLDELALALASRLPDGYRVDEPSSRRTDGERMVRALTFNLTALSGVSLLVAIVLVATTLATSVVQRHHAIALLRSLGASGRQLASAVLVEAAAIGAIGGGAGALLGWLAARAAVSGVSTTVATVVPGAVAGSIELDPLVLGLAVLLGLGASSAAALLPLREALAVPPVQGLGGERPESVALSDWRGHLTVAGVALVLAGVFASLPPLGDRPIWALLSALLLLAMLLALAAPLVDLVARPRLDRWIGTNQGTTALRIAQAALAAGRNRAAWAAGAVGVAVGLAVAMSTMVGSFRQTVVDWTRETMSSDLFVRPILTSSGTAVGGLPRRIEEVARDVFGADAVDAFHASTARVDGRRVDIGGGDFAVLGREGGVPFLDGRDSAQVFAEAAGAPVAVVNEPFSRRFGLARGDTVALETPAGTIERTIAGVYRDYSGHTGRVVLDRADFVDLYSNDHLVSLAIFLDEGADAAAARRQLEEALGGEYAIDVLLNAEVRREVLAVFERTFAVTIALQLLAIVVAALAVVTVLGSLVWERRADLAVVRVLGGSARQIVGVVLAKATLLGAIGSAGGGVVGLLVGWVLVAVVNVQSFGWSLRFLPPWGSLAVMLASIVPACLLAGLLPAVVAMRRSAGRELREIG